MTLISELLPDFVAAFAKPTEDLLSYPGASEDDKKQQPHITKLTAQGLICAGEVIVERHLVQPPHRAANGKRSSAAELRIVVDDMSRTTGEAEAMFSRTQFLYQPNIAHPTMALAAPAATECRRYVVDRSGVRIYAQRTAAFASSADAGQFLGASATFMTEGAHGTLKPLAATRANSWLRQPVVSALLAAALAVAMSAAGLAVVAIIGLLLAGGPIGAVAIGAAMVAQLGPASMGFTVLSVLASAAYVGRSQHLKRVDARHYLKVLSTKDELESNQQLSEQQQLYLLQDLHEEIKRSRKSKEPFPACESPFVAMPWSVAALEELTLQQMRKSKAARKYFQLLQRSEPAKKQFEQSRWPQNAAGKNRFA